MRNLKFGLIALACMAQAAFAFPSWIGVYGEVQRHADGSNPGSFKILMNQDYVGLHAEVGISVNNGAWTTVPLTYAGKKDNNSVWETTPAAPFPSGSIVK